MAPGSPPLTGASRKLTPAGSHAAAIFWELAGAMELMSMTTEAFGRALQHSALAEYGGLRVGRVGHHRYDDGGPLGDLAGRRGGGRAIGDHLLDGGADYVVHRQRVAGLQQVADHGPAHDAESYETNVTLWHGSVFLSCVLCGTRCFAATWSMLSIEGRTELSDG